MAMILAAAGAPFAAARQPFVLELACELGIIDGRRVVAIARVVDAYGKTAKQVAA